MESVIIETNDAVLFISLDLHCCS